MAKRTQKQQVASKATAYKRLGWKAFHAGQHKQADRYFDKARRIEARG
jgi:hypothetical protein